MGIRYSDSGVPNGNCKCGFPDGRCACRSGGEEKRNCFGKKRQKRSGADTGRTFDQLCYVSGGGIGIGYALGQLDCSYPGDWDDGCRTGDAGTGAEEIEVEEVGGFVLCGIAELKLRGCISVKNRVLVYMMTGLTVWLVRNCYMV